MRRARVTSSAIASVGYDPESAILEVEFHDTGIYRYHGVPPDVHAALLAAPSVGTYLTTHIKGRFRYERVDRS